MTKKNEKDKKRDRAEEIPLTKDEERDLDDVWKQLRKEHGKQK